MKAHIDDTIISRARSLGSLISALEADNTELGRHRRVQAIKAAEQHYHDAPHHLRPAIDAAREGQPPAPDPGALAYELGVTLEKDPHSGVGRGDEMISPRNEPARIAG